VTRHAIKVFDPSIYANAKKYWTDMGRIAEQTSKMQVLDSPHLVLPDIYEEFNGIGYIQMGMLDGVGLRFLMDGDHVPRAKARSSQEEWARLFDVIFHDVNGKLAIQPGIAIHIMRRVLRGLESLHETGFVHCDIKPANIMIDRLGTVKVIDYGRGAFIGEQQTFLLGTPQYMAPEQHRREPTHPASDIYAVGLVGLEMLRGEPLMKNEGGKPNENDLLAYKMKLCDTLPDLLPEYVRQNEAFVGVLRKFLHPDPAKRFASAEAAEAGRGGLILVHKQLAQAGKDTEYGRELENYLAKLIDPQTGEVSTETFV
jgi:eukaryotic-like serine/threonine-protein kinase